MSKSSGSVRRAKQNPARGMQISRKTEALLIQRIGVRVDDSVTYMNMKLTKADARSPSRDDMGIERPTRRDRLDSSIWLICVLTTTLVLTGICWRIHVSQIRQSMITSDRNYHELISTLKSKISEISLLDPSQRTCLKSLSAISSDVSVLERMHTDLRHLFTEMETKFRSVNETKAQICELLTNRREQTCPQYWTEKEGWCYFISTSVKSYDGAREHCSKFDARLLEINSNVEKERRLLSSVQAELWMGHLQ
ncbi:C-type lectin domain family 10 member A-like [Mobula birostris]|uniref:C-type lectin domain family 10 member A-like n=1 Tax=Mobula birostris TaxID=1983395 RepID=UPI003B280744